jgi:hypothetical protein
VANSPLGLTETCTIEDLEEGAPHEAKSRGARVGEGTKPGPVREVEEVDVLGVTQRLFATSDERVKSILGLIVEG